MRRGAELLQAGHAKRALPLLVRAHQLAHNDVDVAINLAGAYMMIGRHDQAIPLMEAAAEQAPEHSMVWINLGAAYLGELDSSSPDQQARAITAFEKALELNPAAPSVNYNLGLIYRQRGDLEAASAQFKRAAAINPYDRDARTLLECLQHFQHLQHFQGETTQEFSSNGGNHDH